MSSRNYKLLVLTVVFVISLCLSACGGSPAPEETTEKARETEAAQTVPETQPETEPPIVYDTKTVYLCVSSVWTDYLLDSTSVTMNEYDAFGNLIGVRNEDKNGALRDRMEYGYDDYGNQTHEFYYNAEDALVVQITKSYDENGNMVSQCRYDPEGVLTGQSELTYDESGNLLSEVHTDPDGNITGREIYTYDADGYLIERLLEYDTYDPSKTVYEYNENHTAETVYDVEGDTRTLIEKRSYDEAGNVLVEKEYMNGDCLSEVHYTYDEEGKRIREEAVIPAPRHDNRHEVLYTYDEQGNLLSETVNTIMKGKNYGSQTDYAYEAVEIFVR